MFKLNISYEFKQNVFLLFAAILSIFISFFISFEVVSLRNDWDVVIFIICCPVIWFVLVMFWFAFFPDKESERILLEEIKEKEEQEEKIDNLLRSFNNKNYQRRFVKKHFKVISSAYRNSVTANSFGKKNYKKFYIDLIDFIEENSSFIQELERMEGQLTWGDPEDSSIIEILEDEMKKNTAKLEYSDQMDPYEYEHFCAEQFNNNNWKAKATQGSSDQGVDVIATKNNITLVAQCKRFKKPVGNKAVQEVVAGMKYYQANKGVVIAPNGFTKSAEKLAEANQILLIHHSEIAQIK